MLEVNIPMSNSKSLALLTALTTLGLSVMATTYNGNGNTTWGGAIGAGALTLTDNGTTLNGSLTTGGGFGGNAFVLYLQTAGGGFTTTAGFNDNGDQLRSALSQYGGVGQQSTMNFATGFSPNYGIALQPAAPINFGGLWQLVNGGSGSQSFVSTINLSPTGSDAQGTYTFSINLSSLGLTGGQSFEFMGLMVSTTGFSSPEILGGTVSGANGWGNTQTVTTFSTYTTTPVPEPSILALCGLSGLVTMYLVRRRR